MKKQFLVTYEQPDTDTSYSPDATDIRGILDGTFCGDHDELTFTVTEIKPKKMKKESCENCAYQGFCGLTGEACNDWKPKGE